MYCDKSSYIKDDLSDFIEDFSKIDTTAEGSFQYWFRSVESPFNWQPQRFKDVSPEEVIEVAKEKAEHDDVPFDKFARLLTLVYEYSHQDNYVEAMAMILEAGRLIKHEQETNSVKYGEFRNAMSHVLLGTRAYLLAMRGLEEFAKRECKRLIPLSAMPTTDIACIHAFKAKFFSLYRKEGFQQAVECSRRALEINPEEPMWMFLLAESLRRKEKYFPNSDIPMEELQLLEQAVARDHSARYLVHLALRYNNCANNALNKHRQEQDFYNSELYKTINKMQITATDLYKEALELEPDDEIVNRRCGFGLMKASKTIAKENKRLIKVALDKALKLSPTSSMTLHYLGKYYKTLEGNKAKALDYFQRATQSSTNYPAHCDLIKLKFELYSLDEYNPMQDFERMLKQQCGVDPHYKLKTMGQIGSYFLLVKRDLSTALKYFDVVLNEDTDNNIMKYHRLLFLDYCTTEPVDLYHILAIEIMRADESCVPNKKELLNKIASVSPNYIEEPMNESLLILLLSKLRRKKPCKDGQPQRKRDSSPVVALSWRVKKDDENKPVPDSPPELKNSNSSDNRKSWETRRYQGRRESLSSESEKNWRIKTEDDHLQISEINSNWRQEGAKEAISISWKRDGAKESQNSNWRTEESPWRQSTEKPKNQHSWKQKSPKD